MNKLSLATAATLLGVAMLAAMGNTPARAVNIKEFRLVGTFDTQPVDGNGTGLIAELAGGSFDGRYTVDIDQLPVANNVDGFAELQTWKINLRNSTNTVLKTFSNSLPNSAAAILPDFFIPGDNIVFIDDIDNIFGTLFILSFNPNFTGRDKGLLTDLAEDGQLFSGVLINQEEDFIEQIFVTSVESEPAPEPTSLAAMAMFGATGLWMQRKHKLRKSSC
ncbi:hypothetical protein [Nostoc sp. TCL26-01]|uniref:hypothetical protein n=1 Tax=Nostoc sp. TCL26-01 TaxID=2576904 RepID=UPI0015C0692D|nr:hypothetical protein [Nostoc sp. TCL26-01]QLE58689.1 hypothetical protein FD725_26220 [Nostoc sp. TCL26-01]